MISYFPHLMYTTDNKEEKGGFGPMEQMITIGALVLAGGKNSRMNGYPKGLLSIHGETILSHLEKALLEFPERLLSTGTSSLAENTSFTVVPDEIPGLGPIGGLCSALAVCSSDALLVCACDMPFFTAETAAVLASRAKTCSAPAIAFRDSTGRLHPLCGVYRKTCLPILQESISQGQYRAVEAFFRLGGSELPLSDTGLPENTLVNLNSPEDIAVYDHFCS